MHHVQFILFHYFFPPSTFNESSAHIFRAWKRHNSSTVRVQSFYLLKLEQGLRYFGVPVCIRTMLDPSLRRHPLYCSLHERGTEQLPSVFTLFTEKLRDKTGHIGSERQKSKSSTLIVEVWRLLSIITISLEKKLHMGVCAHVKVWLGRVGCRKRSQSFWLTSAGTPNQGLAHSSVSA